MNPRFLKGGILTKLYYSGGYTIKDLDKCNREELLELLRLRNEGLIYSDSHGILYISQEGYSRLVHENG